METIERGPILALKQQLRDMSDEELLSYIEKLNINRMKGPKPVKRSKETGAPTQGRAINPMDKLDKILAAMPENERAAFIEYMKGETK